MRRAVARSLAATRPCHRRISASLRSGRCTAASDSHVLAAPSDYDPDDVQRAKERLAGLPRGLGRSFESRVMDLLPFNPRCKGVITVLDGHEEYDGKLNPTALDLKKRDDFFALLLDDVSAE